MQQVDCAGILKVFLFNLLGLLLSAIDIVHDLFELDSTRLKLGLRGVTDAIGPVPVDLLLDISNLLSQLLLLAAQLTHIVIE